MTYNPLLLNRIESEIEKILRKNQNGFRRNPSTTSQILTKSEQKKKKKKENAWQYSYL